MSFHHILPSNVAPNVFPKNNASDFNTPLDNPYDLKGGWEVALQNVTYSGLIYTFNNEKMIISEKEKSDRTVVLKPIRFTTCTDATSYIMKKIDDKRITLTSDSKNRLKLRINNPQLSITFDDSLRDILAFDKNTYSGENTFYASDVFSLTRRIRFLYIYSNITDLIRIGNTEASLIAAIPFNSANAINEVSFDNPMYIRVVTDFITKISISIYDDAGALVPFISTSKTVLQLHFRKQ